MADDNSVRAKGHAERRGTRHAWAASVREVRCLASPLTRPILAPCMPTWPRCLPRPAPPAQDEDVDLEASSHGDDDEEEEDGEVGSDSDSETPEAARERLRKEVGPRARLLLSI